MIDKIRIATRGSKLALWQANYIGNEIKKRYPHAQVEYKIIKTSGDKILDVPLAKIGGKGLFVKEIEESLLKGDSDIAVHSMKDVPAVLPDGLVVDIVPKRENPFDCLVSERFKDLDDLPKGAVVGTSSLRRQAQIKKVRPDIEVRMLRGNLDTRIKKLKQGMYDAIIVARAGLIRLGTCAKYTKELEPPLFLPAVAQGALGIEYKENREDIKEFLSFLDHRETKICVMAERTFLNELEGGCQVPIGAFCTLKDNTIVLKGFLSSVDGKRCVYGEESGLCSEPVEIGQRLAKDLLEKGGKEILEEIYCNSEE